MDNLIMLLIIVVVVLVIVCITTIIICRRYVNKTYDSIDEVIDRILLKDPTDLLQTTDDLRISKLTHKANRVIEMNQLETLRSREEKETLQGFISDMSHQMKTPLAGIKMHSEILLEGNLTEEEQKIFLNHVKSGTEKIQWMMDNLIKMSRLEVGTIKLNPIDANIMQTLSESVATVQSLAVTRNVTINIKSFENINLYHDKKWTQEVFVNILENAIKYTNADTEIEVSVETMSLYTKVMITDYGVGIDKNDFHKVFKRFFRGQNVKDNQGVGLGLYLATLIMEKQGGYIMVDSSLNEFTTFSVFLQNCQKKV